MGAWCGAHLSYGAAAAGAGELGEGVREGASDETREQWRNQEFSVGGRLNQHH
jgi:hypothetical protein